MFEPSRLSQAALEAAYEQLAPQIPRAVKRRRLARVTGAPVQRERGATR